MSAPPYGRSTAAQRCVMVPSDFKRFRSGMKSIMFDVPRDLSVGRFIRRLHYDFGTSTSVTTYEEMERTTSATQVVATCRGRSGREAARRCSYDDHSSNVVVTQPIH